MNFHRTMDDVDRTAGHDRQGRQHKPHQGCWEGPYISEGLNDRHEILIALRFRTSILYPDHRGRFTGLSKEFSMSRLITRPRLTAFLVLVAVSCGSIRAQEGPLKGFDDYVAKSMHEWGVPGVAIAIVKNDHVLLAKGYGVRKLGDSKPVTEHTLFAI